MNLSVTRYEFYRNPEGGTLRYTESFPPEDHTDHAVCNCTRNVTDRPTTDPDQVSQSVAWAGEIGPYKAEVHLNRNSLYSEVSYPQFTLRWPGNPDSEEGRKQNHAYFWWSKDRLDVEVTGTGDSYVDCSFGRVHFGNQVDTSRLMNGHSPSRIIDLSAFRPEDVWAHECSFGWESVVHLADGPEKDRWREARQDANRIAGIVRRLNSFVAPVSEVYKKVEQRTELAALLDESFLWYVKVLDGLKTTEMYRASQQAYRETHKKG